MTKKKPRKSLREMLKVRGPFGPDAEEDVDRLLMLQIRQCAAMRNLSLRQYLDRLATWEEENERSSQENYGKQAEKPGCWGPLRCWSWVSGFLLMMPAFPNPGRRAAELMPNYPTLAMLPTLLQEYLLNKFPNGAQLTIPRQTVVGKVTHNPPGSTSTVTIRHVTQLIPESGKERDEFIREQMRGWNKTGRSWRRQSLQDLFGLSQRTIEAIAPVSEANAARDRHLLAEYLRLTEEGVPSGKELYEALAAVGGFTSARQVERIIQNQLKAQRQKRNEGSKLRKCR